jgi:hypothetical protein
MCSSAFAQVTTGGMPGVMEAITLAWQGAQFAAGTWLPPGGKVWQDVPQLA